MAETRTTAPRLLSGGNPQIPKGDGERPVRDDVAAMPGWKRAVGKRLDELVVRAVPGVRQAVRWNQPWYGAGDEGWFASFRCYGDDVQLQLLHGTSLDPRPPKASKHEGVRYLDIHEGDDVDDALLTSWFEQSARLPGASI